MKEHRQFDPGDYTRRLNELPGDWPPPQAPARAVGARRPVTRGDQTPCRGLWPAALGSLPGLWLARRGLGPLATACGCSVNRAGTWCPAARLRGVRGVYLARVGPRSWCTAWTSCGDGEWAESGFADPDVRSLGVAGYGRGPDRPAPRLKTRRPSSASREFSARAADG